MRRDDLLERMDAIGRSVAEHEGTLMLLALGSNRTRDGPA